MTKKENHIITTTSDWGIKDYYLAVVKGQLLSCCSEAVLVDISHSIEPFNISEAAFVLKNSFLHFPEGSWHVVEVSTNMPSNAPYLIVKYRGHFFVGRDDGVFSLIFDNNNPDEIFEINDPPETLFPMRDIYIPVLAQLFQGVDIRKIAHPVSSIRKKFPFVPTVSGNIIKGQVVYVDNYENLVTNIRRSDFDKVQKKTPSFTLYIGGGYNGYEHLKISSNFQETDESNIVVLFVNDYLVITIKHGAAAGLLGGSEGETITIEF
jgi:S-adenosylmethionine hydrolase